MTKQKDEVRPIWLDVSDWTRHLGVVEAQTLQVQVRCPCGGEVALQGFKAEGFCPQCDRPYRLAVRVKTEWRGPKGGSDAAG